MKYVLPVNYEELHWTERRVVREQYIKEQNNLCMNLVLNDLKKLFQILRKEKSWKTNYLNKWNQFNTI